MNVFWRKIIITCSVWLTDLVSLAKQLVFRQYSRTYHSEFFYPDMLRYNTEVVTEALYIIVACNAWARYIMEFLC